jgi:hypothetical protein
MVYVTIPAAASFTGVQPLFTFGARSTTEAGTVVTLVEDAPVAITRTGGPHTFTPGFGKDAMVLKASAGMAAARGLPAPEAAKSLRETQAALKAWVAWYGGTVAKADADGVLADVEAALKDLTHGSGHAFHTAAAAFSAQYGGAAAASTTVTSAQWATRHTSAKAGGYSMSKASKRARLY